MKLVERVRVRAEAIISRATQWWTEATERRPAFGYAAALYDRDQDAFASVLGSAIALRLFLFAIPANVALVGLVNVVRGGAFMDEHLQASVTTGEIARTLSGASFWSSVWIFLSGLVLMVWAARSLARVLATTAVSAWRMHARAPKVSIPSVLALTGVLFATILTASVFSSVRDIGGVAASVGSWAVISLVVATSWYLVMLTQPRGTTDPGALLPGAVMLGLSYAGVHWFMQLYLPNRIERNTDRLGDLAVTVATLGYFFLVGRIMSSSFVVTAVTYERFGSLSQLVFDLPVLRRIPARFPKVATFFDLHDDDPPSTGEEPTEADSTAADPPDEQPGG
jgi:hypothetical protein